MRRTLLCSILAALIAVAPASTQAQAAPKKQTAASKRAAAPAKPATPAVDTRPRMRRDDTPAPVVAAPAAAAVKKKRSAGRKKAPGVAVQKPAETAAPAARATPRDVAACAQARDADLAIGGCTRVIDDKISKPKARAAAYFNRGNALVTKGEQDKAIADFDEVIKLEPKNASAYNNRGNARNDKGDSDGAIADFDAAIKQNARYASAYFNRGNARAAKGETARAITDYDAAIKYNRRNVNAYIARGALQLAGGAAAKARADMKQAARLAPKNTYAVLWQDIAERRAKQKGVLAKEARGRGTKGLDMKAWPAPVIRLYTGELKTDAVLAAADNPSATVKTAQLCEANFYSGEFALIGGGRDEAVKLFQTAAKECPHGFLEGIAAAAELKGLGEKVGAN